MRRDLEEETRSRKTMEELLKKLVKSQSSVVTKDKEIEMNTEIEIEKEESEHGKCGSLEGHDWQRRWRCCGTRAVSHDQPRPCQLVWAISLVSLRRPVRSTTAALP